MKKVPPSSKSPAPLEQPGQLSSIGFLPLRASFWVCPEEQIKIAPFKLWIVHKRGQPAIKGLWHGIALQMAKPETAQGYPG